MYFFGPIRSFASVDEQPLYDGHCFGIKDTLLDAFQAFPERWIIHILRFLRNGKVSEETTHRCALADSWMRPGSECVSMRDAVVIASPYMQYLHQIMNIGKPFYLTGTYAKCGAFLSKVSTESRCWTAFIHCQFLSKLWEGRIWRLTLACLCPSRPLWWLQSWCRFAPWNTHLIELSIVKIMCHLQQQQKDLHE